MTNQHVTRNSDGTWNVLGAGNSKVTKIHQTQAEARKHAIEIAKNQKSEVIVHGRDNKIRERNSYGNDPNPPKG
ncbi:MULTISPECIES: DUF2188 domain-containing protein [Staphylococcaceae]|uniref:DUF2188 domain-containing protein n=1 Tax=Macrococcus armenti TaxID=2875764 RepID=A0ABY4A092_9STAP|nr:MULTISPECIES: DUF2188 domain-containing protein [Macrococcus]QNR07769.1 DUF2188 domain-containing protein [Macrococcus canis]UOB21476.1 DUF2188 domain-containing protein [Macrococcus armenti]